MGRFRGLGEVPLVTQGPSVSPSLAFIPLIVSPAQEIRAGWELGVPLLLGTPT